MIRQAATVNTKKKKKIKSPVIIAPITLVAANVIPRRITAVTIVPIIPVKNRLRIWRQLFLWLQQLADVKSVMPKKPTAIPSNTHKNAGVIVTIAKKVKNAAMIPKIMLATKAMLVQLGLQSLYKLVIYFTSTS